jgi:hypothetical protein
VTVQPSLDNEEIEDEDHSDSEEDENEPENPTSKGVGAEFMRLIKRLSRQASIAHAKRPSVYSSDAVSLPRNSCKVFSMLVS